MIKSSAQHNSANKGLIKAILITGLIAGTLDIIAATIQTLLNDRDPVVMLKFIASGIFGPEALKGSQAYAAYGLFFHYCIATGWTALLFFIYPKIGFFSKNWILTGFVYGFFVWIMMNRVVLPLSNTPSIPFTMGWHLLKSMMVIIVAVGLPVSYFAKKHFSNRLS